MDTFQRLFVDHLLRYAQTGLTVEQLRAMPQAERLALVDRQRGSGYFGRQEDTAHAADPDQAPAPAAVCPQID